MKTKYYFICMELYIFPPAFIPNFSFCSSKISSLGNQDYIHFRKRNANPSKRLSNLLKVKQYARPKHKSLLSNMY